MFGLTVKKQLRTNGISARLVNKDNKAINAAVFKKEKLSESRSELNFFTHNHILYFGVTVAYQDVDEYSERDLAKNRDMQVGMLPPKLSQTMINLAGESKRLYDPFVGLGTVLIEAIHSGIPHVFASDISLEMVTATQKNVGDFLSKRANGSKKILFDVFKLDAKNIGTAGETIRKFLPGSSIVTE